MSAALEADDLVPREDESTDEVDTGENGKSKVKFSLGNVLGEEIVGNDRPRPSFMTPVKPLNLRVYTEDNQFETFTFPRGRHTTAGEILSAMLVKLQLPDEMKNVFSIWLMSSYLQLQLKSYHVPVKLFKKWHEFLSQYTTASYDVCKTDQPVLYFRRNAFVSLKEEKQLIIKKNSRKTISLLYREAVNNVVCGRYPLNKEELMELASIQCAIDNQHFDEAKHTPSFFKDNLKTYFPAHLLATGSSMKSKLLGSGLEAGLVSGYKKIWEKVTECSSKRMEATVDVEKSAVAKVLGLDEEKKLWQDTDLQLKLLYLQRCWNKPYYGCVMFRGQVERKTNIKYLLAYSDRHVIVGINPECIHLFTDTNPREILLYLNYDLFSWYFQPATVEGENYFSSLWLEFDSTQGSQKVAKRLQIFSRQAPMMDAMITRCVDELDKEDEKWKKQRGDKDAPIHSITTNAALRSAKNYQEDKLKCDVYKPTDIPDQQVSPKKRRSRDDTVKDISPDDNENSDDETGKSTEESTIL